jgi:hypothetical protein
MYVCFTDRKIGHVRGIFNNTAPIRPTFFTVVLQQPLMGHGLPECFNVNEWEGRREWGEE